MEGLPHYHPPPRADTFQEKSGSHHFGRGLFLEGLIMSVVRLSLIQNTDPLFVFIGRIKYKNWPGSSWLLHQTSLTPASSKAVKPRSRRQFYSSCK